MQDVIESTELAKITEQNQLPAERASALSAAYGPLFVEAGPIVAAARAINVTDATQVSEIKKARASRLALKDLRVRADKARKALKEDSLRFGRAIDGAYNVFVLEIEPLETRLMEMEQFAERKEAERKAALKSSREELLRPFGVDTTFYQLGDMPEPTFAQLLESSKLAHQARIDAAAKVEADRLARIEAERAEQERVRAENARLKAEAEAAEKAAQAERERVAAEARAAEAKAKAEREAIEAQARADREKAAAELRAAEDKARKEREAAALKLRQEQEARERIEAQQRAEKAAAEKKAAAEAQAKAKAERAPDLTKVRAVATALRGITPPVVKSREAQAAIENIFRSIASLAKDIDAIDF